MKIKAFCVFIKCSEASGVSGTGRSEYLFLSDQRGSTIHAHMTSEQNSPIIKNIRGTTSQELPFCRARSEEPSVTSFGATRERGKKSWKACIFFIEKNQCINKNGKLYLFNGKVQL